MSQMSPAGSSQASERPAREAPGALAIIRATAQESTGARLKVAGLPVFERALRQLSRVGSQRILVIGDGTIAAPRKLPRGVEVEEPTPDVEAAIALLRRRAGTPPIAVVGADVVRRQSDPLTGGLRVTDETTRRLAEDAVFAELLRGDLGFIARHLNKKISFRLTRSLLCQLPVTPNQVTLGAMAIGMAGCLLIGAGTYSSMVAGFALVQLQSILDGCDGELARVRFQQSPLGEWLDTLADDFLNLALVASMGLGLWRAGRGLIPVAVSALACGMLLVYNAVSYRELVRQGVGGELLKIRWKLARGLDMKSMMNQSSQSSGAPPARPTESIGDAKITGREVSPATRAFLMLGRRDFFIFSWMLLSIAKLVPLALLWASIIAATLFVTAVGQLVGREPAALD